MADTFFSDISEFQVVADERYPHPVLAVRVDNGSRIDFNAAGNWRFCRTSDRIQVAIGYVVFLPGQAQAIFDRVKAFFGDKAPSKLAMMIDMESGLGFAGPGDHSAGANELADLFAHWLGDRARVIGYANAFDWANNWPNRPDWLKRFTAAYSTIDPGTFGWQYYGGVPDNPSPDGYARSCPPFGSHVDMNVIHSPVDQIAAALGIGDAMPTAKEVADEIFGRVLVTDGDNKVTFADVQRGLRNRSVAAAAGLADLEHAIDNLPAGADGALSKADVVAALRKVFADAGTP